MLNRSFKIPAVVPILLFLALLLCGIPKFRKALSKGVKDGSHNESLSDRILIAGGRLVMIDRASKTVLWQSTELHGALSVATLPNGDFLVGEGKSIARVNGEGKLVLRNTTPFKMTTDVKSLSNERMLVSDGPAGKVVEMDWAGNIFWSVSKLHHPSEAVRLENGNTLIADGTAALKEFDSSGNLLRTTWLKQWAGAVQRFPDGNTLVGESQSFELLDMNGHPMWSLQVPSRVTGVQRLSDNEYLISEPDTGSVAILDMGGRIIWEVTGLRYPWRAIYVR